MIYYSYVNEIKNIFPDTEHCLIREKEENGCGRRSNGNQRWVRDLVEEIEEMGEG